MIFTVQGKSLSRHSIVKYDGEGYNLLREL